MTSTALPYRRPLLSRSDAARLALLLLVSGALLLLTWWWRDPSTRLVRTTGDELVQVGRATGLLAAYLLLVQIVVMARVPVLEARIGADWLARAHRWLGSYVAVLIAVHVGAVVTGYAASDHGGVAHEAATMVMTYPHVLMATVGTALLALVVVVSLARLRSVLPYEVWHTIHLAGYLTIALALWHQMANGAQFLSNPTARHLWLAVHVAVLLLLVRYRVLEPVRLSLRHRFRVEDVAIEADGSASIYVVGRGLHELPVRPGQFFRWRFLARGHWLQAHPFSLSEAPNGLRLRMTAKAVGDHTAALRSLQPDTAVMLEGPYGALTAELGRGAPMLLVAGGSGVAPLLALLQEAVVERRQATLLYRVRDIDSAPFVDELTELAAEPGINVLVLGGPRGRGRAHDVLHPARLREMVPDISDRDVYLCGPAGMVRHVRRSLALLGVPAGHIHHESFEL